MKNKIFSGSTTIAFVECYDVDNNKWYSVSHMNLNRSALRACVLTGLDNAREYSYLSKSFDLGQGSRLESIYIISLRLYR